MPKKTLHDVTDAELSGRLVLVRVDYNVPLDREGTVVDDVRIRRTLPTLAHLREAGARVVLIAHMGRPQGQVAPELSLKPVRDHLARVLGTDVGWSDELTGPQAAAVVTALTDGQLALLENTRFDPGETANDPALAEKLAAFADVYVNDAFGTAHRAHASTEGVARAVRARGGQAVAGLLMERELRFLGGVLENPARPFVGIIGGAKISGKIDVIEALLARVDRLLIGGAMANTFFSSLGLEVGKSLVEEDRIDMAGALLETAGDKILLPVDCTVAPEIAADASIRHVARHAVAADEAIGDIGPDSAALFRREIMAAATVVWNGPMGVFELAPFAASTFAVAEAAAQAADGGAVVVLGGGDSAAAAEAAGIVDRVTHVSTGGGASLEFLSGVALPGVTALSDS